MKKQKARHHAQSAAYQRGSRVRRKVLGAEHVARATAAQTEFDADFQTLITETAWGSVWARPGLDLRTRQLITIAMLAALGRAHELELHLRSIQNCGTTWKDVREVLMQVAVYAGLPAANAAMAIAKPILFPRPDSTKG